MSGPSIEHPVSKKLSPGAPPIGHPDLPTAAGRISAALIASLALAAAMCAGCGSSGSQGGHNAGSGPSSGGGSGGISNGSGSGSNTGNVGGSGGSGGSTGSSSGIGSSSSSGGAAKGGSGSSSGGGGSSGGGSSSSSGGGSGSGAADGGSMDSGGLPPFKATGMPIPAAPDGQWTWVDFPDSFCRDGSTAGIAVTFESASTKLMIYLEGGGACFDALTCAANPASVGTQSSAQSGGLWDRSNAMNPVKDWNAVYIPYCTGDIHSGTNANGMVSGVTGTQMFVGRKNLEAYLNRIVPTFPNVTQVLLTGMSAGGFGAASNAILFERAFPGVKGVLVDDSGPPMSDMQVPPCMQDAWRTLWGLDGSLLADCGSHCPNNMDYVLDFAKYQASLFTDRMSGLIDSNDDSVITQFFGIGNDSGKNDCGGTFGLTPVSAADYQAGLDNFRSVITAVDPNFGTYYPVSTQHVWINGASLYTETQDGTALIDWLTKIVNNQSVSQVGP